jgi:hypothetical protein
MSIPQTLTAFSAAAFLLTAAAAPAAADVTTCRGKIGQVTVDDLRVPRGATCELNRTKVKGAITVESGATVTATRIVVIGNLTADDARSVTITRKSRIGGSIEILQGKRAKVADSEIDGSMRFEKNSGRLKISGNVVGGHLRALQNSGGVAIDDNVVDGDLVCRGNRPVPEGGDNTVLGTKQDQCRNL